MLDYARRLRSAVSDTGRRAGLKASAGILGAVAAGFLVVALLFAAGAGVLWVMGSKVRHPVPSTDELKREVEARARLAADAAVEKARLTAVQVVDHAEAKAQAVVSRLVRDAKASPTATAMALAVFGVAAFSASRDRRDED